jgi:hypothetical protein
MEILIIHDGLRGLNLVRGRFIEFCLLLPVEGSPLPLLDQGFPLDDFELEGGQFDGTLAHALECLISLEVKRSGWQIKEMSGNPGAVPGFGYGLVD